MLQNPDVGMKRVSYGPDILIDGADAETLKENDKVTFINWGNMIIKRINKFVSHVTPSCILVTYSHCKAY